VPTREKMKKTEKGIVLTLATKITIGRILAVPVFVLLLTYYILSVKGGAANEMYRWAALVVFLAASLSDALDGYVARSRNEITRLGQILDPIADKSLMLSAVILLTRPYQLSLPVYLPIWFSVLIISREVILIGGAFLVHHFVGKVEVRPHVIGKAATLFQMTSVAWVLSGYRSPLFYVCVAIAAVLTCCSGALYVVDGLRQIEAAHQAESNGRE